MASRIKKLVTNGVSGLKTHEVGQNGVTEIRDNSLETDQTFTLMYFVYVEKKLRYSYENGVYEIEFFR